MPEHDSPYEPLEKLSPVLWRRRLKGNPNAAIYLHWCQGCGHGHTYPTGHANSKHNWGFNGNFEKPSFTPSMLFFVPAGRYGDPDMPQRTICHYFVTDGEIRYCKDSPHKFSGQNLSLQPIPDDYGF